MKKILLILSFLALSAFAQDEYATSNEGSAQSEQASQQASRERPLYSFQTAAMGVSFWHNWEDESSNPKRDWTTELFVRYGHIWEMTPHGAITALTTHHTSFDFDAYEVHGNFLLGGRYSILDGIVSPFIGLGLGVGYQVDFHFEDWDFGEKYAVGMSFGGEIGVTIFHNSTVQLEAGFGYSRTASKFDFGRGFGAFELFFGLNY